MVTEVLEFQHVPKGALFEHEGTTYRKIVAPASCWPNPKSIEADRSFGMANDYNLVRIRPHTKVFLLP